MRIEPRRAVPALVAGLFLASAAHPAVGLSIYPYGDCEELCAPLAGQDPPMGGASTFWFEASAADVTAALKDKPEVLPFLRTMLCRAVKAGNLAAVEVLLRHGAPPNSLELGHHGKSILAEAAGRGKGLFTALLKAGAFADDPPPPPCGALCDAVFWKTATTQGIRAAFVASPTSAARPGPGGGPLHFALAAGGDVAFARLLLDLGVNPNGRAANDDTPLHVAARTPGSAEALRLLLERGAILNALNTRDRTALHEAAARASTTGNMRVLLDAGANPGAVAGDTFAETPRKLAVSHPEGPDAAALILGYRNAEGIPLNTLLRVAARKGHPDTVRLLIYRGAEVNGSNLWGDKALSFAVSTGNVKTMRVLLRHGADPNDGGWGVSSGPGKLPLRLAVGNPVAVALLLEAGADPDGQMRYPHGRMHRTDRRPLHLAAERCEAASLALLLAGGADHSARDRDRWTPLHWAVLGARNSKAARSRTELLAKCAAEATEGGRKKCRSRAAARLRDWHEARHRCLGNIATLIRHGADPGVGAEVESERDVTPLDLARRFGLDKFIVEMMEDALPRGRR